MNDPKAQPDPTLDSYTPEAVASDESQYLTLTGQRFKDGAKVLVNDQVVGLVTSVKPTAIGWLGTLSVPGSAALTVRNPDRRVSNAIPLTVTEPVPPDIEIPPIDPPAAGDYGPRPIPRPDGSIEVLVGANLQQMTESHPAGTTFFVRAGVHPITYAIVPKTGNRYVGELGAILDGTGWTSSDPSTAVFRVTEQNVDRVTLENLVIRNVEHKGIYVFHSQRPAIRDWAIASCEIAACGAGIIVGFTMTIRDSYIHDCRQTDPSRWGPGGAYGGYGHYGQIVNGRPNTMDGVRFVHNEIARCGTESHMLDMTNLLFQRNWIHDMDYACIWSDGVGTGFVAEDNVLDGASLGVFFELSAGGRIQRNTIRRMASNAVMISTTRDTEILENTLEDCTYGITYFVNFESLAQGWGWGADLANNYAHHNTTKFSAAPGSALAAVFTWAGTGDLSPWALPGNAKNNRFDYNTYAVPAGAWAWLWAPSTMDWAGWQAGGHEAHGTVSYMRRRSLRDDLFN